VLVLALNCGSSSIKAALIDSGTQSRLAEIRIENLGTASCELREGGHREQIDPALASDDLIGKVLDRLEARGAIEAVAHRVVHGGMEFTRPLKLDDAAVARLDALSALAPLHNPPALSAIRASRKRLPQVPHIAVFDTAFHGTLPRRSREYALPREVVERHGLRRYGFHGLSHAHVATATARYMQVAPQALRIVSCHLGNGASVTAIEYGRSVETSMGMTPLEGLVMGTRPGDVDAGILLHLLGSGDYDAGSLGTLLNRESGLKGLTGTEDMRDIERRAAGGDEGCRLAIAVYAHRVRKYVGAYAATMGGVDVIAFTGGVGEHSALIRHRIAQRLDFLGAVLDEDRNRDAGPSHEHPVIDIATERSRVRVLVIQADEEAAMAQGAAECLAESGSARKRLTVPIAISARHAHLSQATLDGAFGPGHVLTPAKPLSQPGQFAAVETITLVGPGGRIDNVRVLGPPRADDQIEISRSDEFVLGIDAPVRISGDTDNSPGIVVAGPEGRVQLRKGVICARRHIHMHPDDAQVFGVTDHDTVAVRIDSEGRDLVFGDVTVRVSPAFRLEMHIDADEANAAGIEPGSRGELVSRSTGT